MGKGIKFLIGLCIVCFVFNSLNKMGINMNSVGFEVGAFFRSLFEGIKNMVIGCGIIDVFKNVFNGFMI